jgi:hypothetical protein
MQPLHPHLQHHPGAAAHMAAAAATAAAAASAAAGHPSVQQQQQQQQGWRPQSVSNSPTHCSVFVGFEAPPAYRLPDRIRGPGESWPALALQRCDG